MGRAKAGGREWGLGQAGGRAGEQKRQNSPSSSFTKTLAMLAAPPGVGTAMSPERGEAAAASSSHRLKGAGGAAQHHLATKFAADPIC